MNIQSQCCVTALCLIVVTSASIDLPTAANDRQLPQQQQQHHRHGHVHHHQQQQQHSDHHHQHHHQQTSNRSEEFMYNKNINHSRGGVNKKQPHKNDVDNRRKNMINNAIREQRTSVNGSINFAQNLKSNEHLMKSNRSGNLLYHGGGGGGGWIMRSFLFNNERPPTYYGSDNNVERPQTCT